MPYRLTKIYTRTGDDGKTNLGDHNRLAKNSPRIEALGTLDELNCAIGLTLSFAPNSLVMKAVAPIQHTLFDIGGELCPPYHQIIDATHTTKLEHLIDEWNDTLPPLKEFLIPQGIPAVSACHLARSICRRAERTLVTLKDQEFINPSILQFINRLSDLLFVAARILAKENLIEEEIWDHQKK